MNTIDNYVLVLEFLKKYILEQKFKEEDKELANDLAVAENHLNDIILFINTFKDFIKIIQGINKLK